MYAFSKLIKNFMIASLFAIATFAHTETGKSSVQTLQRSQQLIKAAGYSGSFVIQRAQKAPEVVQGDVDKKLIPASTFKVLLALVALEDGAIKSADEIVPWNKIAYPTQPSWQRDMAMREAMQNSSESYFGTLAQRIGPVKLKAWLAKLHYGNQQMGAMPEKAWLEGVLLISALDQLAFMEALRNQTLPVQSANIEAVKKAMLDHELKSAKLYFKTGSMPGPTGPGLGWLVGWLECASPEKSARFVLQIDLPKMDDRQKRIALVKRLLRAQALL